jgi:hypothetical protein
MNMYGGGNSAPPFLTTSLDGGEWSASRPYYFTPRERIPGTHSLGGSVGPRAGLEDLEKSKVLLYQDSNSTL